MRFENHPYDEIAVGRSAELTRLCTPEDLIVFANASGNHNPLHLRDIDGDGPAEQVAPSMWVGSLISAVLGNLLPGPGTLYRSQHLEFVGRAHAGDELRVRVEVTDKRAGGLVALATDVVRVRDGAPVCRGEALVEAPREKMSVEAADVPGLVVQRHVHFDALLAHSAELPPMPTAVVAPEDDHSLGGAMLAARHGLIVPILVGDPDRIRAAAEAAGEDIAGVEIVAAGAHAEAAGRGVDLVVEGRAKALMKGHLHTDDLLRAALRKERGLRAGRRFTHVFVMDVPGVAHPVLVTDAAINIAPDLRTKMDIVQNAIDLARSLGIETPKVAVLSAVETVNPDLPSSTDAALLAKMAERGQITGGLVDGPLAMDNAVSLAAARTKGITGPVAGRAEVLVAPALDAGNMLAKQLAYVAGAEGAGIVLGASCPIILTSRADDEKARLASAAVAAVHWVRQSGGGQA